MELEKSESFQIYAQSNKTTSRNRILKDENNYYEWRRVDLSCDNIDEPNYKESTFELENQRLEQFILKN